MIAANAAGRLPSLTTGLELGVWNGIDAGPSSASAMRPSSACVSWRPSSPRASVRTDAYSSRTYSNSRYAAAV